MFYDYAELDDGTQLAYSNVLDNGIVEVSVERPVELGFNSARCVLPSFDWEDVEGFSPEEMVRLNAFVQRNAPLILRLAREASKVYA